MITFASSSEPPKASIKMVHISFIYTFCALLYGSVQQAWGDEVTKCEVHAEIDSGKICGFVSKADGNVQYNSFLGIPYAKPPVGQLRFAPLEAVEPWDDEFEATKEGPMCPQNPMYYGHLLKNERGQSEDCLRVNVFTPAESSGLLSIVVVMSEGGFQTGAAHKEFHGPEHLMRHGVMVVAGNVRIGVPGFLSLNTTKVPGNNALRDYITLLNWVQTNGKAFGGDTNNVLLYGVSTGAVMAHLLAISKECDGLMTKLWLSSGSAIDTFYSRSRSYADTMANSLRAQIPGASDDPEEFYEQLVNMNINELMAAYTPVQISNIVALGPVIDEQFPSSIQSLVEGKDTKYPMVISGTNNEMQFIKNVPAVRGLLELLKTKPELILSPGHYYTLTSDEATERGKAVISKYLKEGYDLDDVLAVASEEYITYPIRKLMQIKAKLGGEPTYVMRFSYEADDSVIKNGVYLNYTGAVHCEDETYILKSYLRGEKDSYPPTTTDEQMIDMMTTMLANFAKYGTPTPNGEWSPISSDNIKYLNVVTPYDFTMSELTDEEIDDIQLYDTIETRLSEPVSRIVSYKSLFRENDFITSSYGDMTDIYKLTFFIVTLVNVLQVEPVKECTRPQKCEALVRIESGLICGKVRLAEKSTRYYSFRGVPYAKPPLNELRFAELKPMPAWDGIHDASEEGPACPQRDIFYGRIQFQPKGMSEDCMYVNIHAPINADLISDNIQRFKGRGLRILVFIPGGGYSTGSGNSDLHGPEFLMYMGEVVVVTFNYRLNVFGYLSLNDCQIPGNAGLRDQITLLKWVKRNARSFGGNPDDITLMGQSVGATCAHLLTMSKAAEGLFNRVILMSGTAVPNSFTTLPAYAKSITDNFFQILGYNTTNNAVRYRLLTTLSLTEIMAANDILQMQYGMMAFTPTLEPKCENFTRVVAKDPLASIAEGRGKHLPMLIGFVENEVQFFKWLMYTLDMASRVQRNPLILVPQRISLTDLHQAMQYAENVKQFYFNGTISIEGIINFLTGLYFQYPAMKLALWRSAMKAAPVYLYQYSYVSEQNLVKDGLWITYNGSAHLEDLTYVFRVNTILPKDHISFPPTTDDDKMRAWMTNMILNFMHCSNPTCSWDEESSWPPVSADAFKYQDIAEPNLYSMEYPTAKQQSMTEFLDNIDKDVSIKKSKKKHALIENKFELKIVRKNYVVVKQAWGAFQDIIKITLLLISVHKIFIAIDTMAPTLFLQ
ncbi:hypothetical protein K1T71_010558 [Dendrolimus kikuchii]|uniref:Uncharacterized protein n=1 Tax=Dendrolimus kikuchii TaxID=765133 RepID=A0ACC1CPS4_9NEOP|nr:hypothetical protein K1T71_010558 [Dendrolimus kikuchii]